jgi:hypothetical protein
MVNISKNRFIDVLKNIKREKQKLDYVIGSERTISPDGLKR